MRLRRLKLTNFRAYKQPTTVEFNDLTAIVGKNDIGKTTILEALDIFFEGGTCSLDVHDLCKDAGTDKTISIEVAFDCLPTELILDDAVKTTLADEQLLDDDGLLVVRKNWDCSKVKPKVQVEAIATHQILADGTSPLELTNAKLKTECAKLKADTSAIKLTENPPLRAALRTKLAPANKGVKIPLDADGGKSVWDALQQFVPTFALFKSDRDSTDADSEVQDPLKFAISQAMKDQEKELRAIQQVVERQAQDVAERTLSKLREMDPKLAAELTPRFDTPKWDSVFKANLNTEKGIPLNKRGSGVRRLILLNFFRAEAERQAEKSGRPIIYAIEEPETSQHPDNQRMLIDAFKELASTGNVQVVLTTHVPALAGLIDAADLRLVRSQDGQPNVFRGDSVLADIAETLGVIADKRLEVLVCVEGPHDVDHLTAYCRMLRAGGIEVIDLESDPRVAVIPLGGATLKNWVAQHYLRRLGAKEYHIYDRDMVQPDGSFKYQPYCQNVNARNNGSSGRLTIKREIENYLHPKVIEEVFGVVIAITDDCDVPKDVVEAVNRAGLRIPGGGNVKARLAEAASKMTLAQLQERGGDTEIRGWFGDITGMLAPAPAQVVGVASGTPQPA